MNYNTISFDDFKSGIPQNWIDYFDLEQLFSIYKKLQEIAQNNNILPKIDDLFNAFKYTNPADLKVVILGQDPYPNKENAMGLSFSVKNGVKIPASLNNIFKEIKSNYKEYEMPNDGNLENWARQGILLLNTTLTITEGKSNSHSNIGWNIITTNILKKLNDEKSHIIFIGWGKNAQNTIENISNWINSNINNMKINEQKNVYLFAPHPSPMAKGAFFGNMHFIMINTLLKKWGKEEIQW